MNSTGVDALVVDHWPLLQRIVSQECRRRRIPARVDREDLMSAGAIGLWQAAERFNTTGTTSFAAYASFRIRGAIIDEMRTAAPLTRGEWERAQRDDVVVRRMLSLDEARDAWSITTPPDDDAADDREARIAAALRRLPPRLATMVRYYFWHELTMAEIGRRFGLAESRVSQLLAEARRRLRQELGEFEN